ncbi:MAG: S9 family peptidase [Euryarchaeota archaeon]|nr:S9 family peptidase [Euryarchaeota archaeon]
MRKALLVLLILAALLSSACIDDEKSKNGIGTPATGEPDEKTRRENCSQIIPREVLFGNPDKESPLLSPDGTRISYLAPVGGVMNIWVGPADNPGAAEPVTDDTGHGIRYYAWAYTSKHILYIRDRAGDENWRAYSVDPITRETVDLTPFEDMQAIVYGISPKCPGEIVVAMNDHDPELHDFYRVNITTGERILIQVNKGFLCFVTDDDYTVRFAVRVTADGGIELLKPSETGGWKLFTTIPMADTFTTDSRGFDRTGAIMYLIDSRDRDTAALFAVDTGSGERTLIAMNARTDVSDVMIHPTKKNVQAVAFTYARKNWQVIDKSIVDDFVYLSVVADGDFEIVSRTLDDRYWMVAYEMDDGPVRYYRYDRTKRNAEFLFTNRAALEDLPLSKIHPVVIKSRDGLDLVSYYTLPAGSGNGGDRDGYPDEPLPMVLLVHDGPWARDDWGYSAESQWLANRGYAVLNVNFRSSTGFGKAVTNAGDLEWGGKMHDDLIDAVDWAVREGVADPDRVAIMGRCYGGYAVLWGMTSTPETFACGVDISGPSNLVTLLETVPPYWQPMIEVLTTRMGDYRTEEGRAFLSERSPLTYVDRIENPLLIAHGANDPRVKQAESDQIVRVMQERNISVTYLLYPDEGQEFARPENELSFYAVTEAFLAEHLGGRHEPVGDDLEGSSITVPVGAEEVPGLADAMADYNAPGNKSRSH